MISPPAVLLRWLPTEFGAGFGAYRIYRRPTRAAAFDWVQVAEIEVPDGQDPAVVEETHNGWVDYAPGWATEGGAYEDGWDYAVVAYNSTTTLRSAISDGALTRIVVPPADVTWMVCNSAPWLNAPLTKVQKVGGEDLDQVDVYRPIGRDFAVTRGRSELPARQWALSWRHMGMVGEDPGRYVRAARASGRQVTVLTPRGDRLEGSLISGQLGQTPEPVTDAEATLVETARDPQLAGYNLPCGVRLDGSSEYATVPDDASIDPGADPFTVVLCSGIPEAGGVMLSKGDALGASSYGLRRTVTPDALVEDQSGSGTVDGRVTSTGQTLEGFGVSPVGSLTEDPTRIPEVSSGYMVIPGDATGASYAKAILTDTPVVVRGELQFHGGTPSTGSGVAVLVSRHDTPGLDAFAVADDCVHLTITPQGLQAWLLQDGEITRQAIDTYADLAADTTYRWSMAFFGRTVTFRLETTLGAEVALVSMTGHRIPLLWGRAVVVEALKTNAGDMQPKVGPWEADTVGGLQFYVAGAAVAGGPTESTDRWLDDLPHVASASSDGTAQSLYVDGVPAASAAVAHGSVANAAALTVGANNGGASAHVPLQPLIAWAYYPRALTAEEHSAAAHYLLGHPGFRMPTGAEVFYDLRDDRCWDGVHQTLSELGDGTLDATLVGSPPTRGEPWPLRDLDRWA